MKIVKFILVPVFLLLLSFSSSQDDIAAPLPQPLLSMQTDAVEYEKEDIIAITGTCRENSIVIIDGILSDGKEIFSSSEICQPGGNYVINYKITFLNPSGDWTLKAFNEGAEDTKNITVKATRESGFLLITLLNPNTFEHERGNKISLNVRLTDAGVAVEDAEIVTWNTQGKKVPLSHTGNGTYSTNLQLPYDFSTGEWDLTLTSQSAGVNPIGGEKVTPMQINKTDFVVTLLKPETVNFDAGFPVDFELSATYPDLTPIRDPKVVLNIFRAATDSGEECCNPDEKLNKEEIIFEQDPTNPKLFRAQYVSTLEEIGAVTAEILITDNAGNSGQTLLGIVVSEDPLAPILRNSIFIVIGLIIVVIIVYFVVWHPYKKVKGKHSVLSERKQVEQLIKKAQLDYFERNIINRETYNRKIAELNARKTSIERKLKVAKK